MQQNKLKILLVATILLCPALAKTEKDITEETADIVQRAWDKMKPLAGSMDINWEPRNIIKIITREFMVSTIKLPSWESARSIEVGDPTNFEVKKIAPTILYIHSTHVGSDTNLTIIGRTGNVYVFYVRSEPHNSPYIPDLTVKVNAEREKDARDLQFHKSKVDGGDSKGNDFMESIPFDPSQLDFDFFIAGNKSLSPSRVYTDGIFTWFDFGSSWNKTDIPIVLQLKDGVESPVNTRVEGSKIIAEASGSFVLKSGNKICCVYQEKDGEEMKVIEDEGDKK